MEAESQGEDIPQPDQPEPLVVRICLFPTCGVQAEVVKRHRARIMAAVMACFEEASERAAFQQIGAVMREAKAGIDPELYDKILVYVCGRVGQRICTREICL